MHFAESSILPRCSPRKARIISGQRYKAMRYRILLKGPNLLMSAALMLSCALFVFISKKQNITQKLESIPNEEKFFMESFFRILISCDNGSYVLFGDKPASFMIYEEWQNDHPQPITHFPTGTDFSPERTGFGIWQKYQPLFPSKNYALIKVESCLSNHVSAIFLIHKKRLLKVITENFTDFQKIFSHFGSPKSLLQAILNDPSTLRQICSESDLLLGIILGFGKDNAALFEKKMKISALLSSDPSVSPIQRPWIGALPLLKHSILKKQLEILEHKSDGVIENPDKPGIEWGFHLPLGFLVDTEKTDLAQLRAQLKQSRIKATQAYRHGEFLHVTLSELSN